MSQQLRLTVFGAVASVAALFYCEEITMAEQKEITGLPSIDKPWLKYYSEEAINTALPECSIYEYLVQNNKDFPSDVAIIYLDRKITYKELFENIDKTAAAFLKLGVKEKEIVTVALPSIPEALYCVYALNKIGAVANMIHPLPGKDEMIFYLNEVKSRIAVIFDGAYKTIANDISKTGVENVIVASPADSMPIALKVAYYLKVKKPKLDGKRFLSWNYFIQNGKGTTVNEVKRECHEMALISHTGGTTGEPKGVMCSDYSLIALMLQIVCNFSFERNGCSLVVLPPFINYSLLEATMAMLNIGYKVVLIPKYETYRFAEYVKKYRPTVILSIPPYWEAILDSKEEIDLNCFEHIYYGGEGMTVESEEAINCYLEKCGSKTKLCKGLGSTELMAGATQSFPECNPIGSVGIPLVLMNCRIEDPETGRELQYGQEGELCFSGPTLMLGYYNNPEATNEVVKLHADGQRWLHTGDLGYMNEKGIVYVTGRIKRIYMTKGKDGNITKIFPDRIEKVIAQCSCVSQSCVVGVADDERINYPKAYIVVNDDSNTDNAKQSILGICKINLPDYMIPEEIEFVADLPRTPRGKIDYRALENSSEESR